MNDRNLVRGLFLMVISLGFGLTSLKYPIGEFGRAGPGLFPLMVSLLLLLVGIATVVRSRFIAKQKIDFQFKNIVVILTSLAGFSLISQFVNMIVGIVFLVFCASLAATSYSTVRNLKIAAVLVGIAFAFTKFLGVNLPLY